MTSASSGSDESIIPTGVGMAANNSSGNSKLRFNLIGPGVGLGVGLGNWVAVAVGAGVEVDGVSVIGAWVGTRAWHAEKKRLRVRKSRKIFLLSALIR